MEWSLYSIPMVHFSPSIEQQLQVCYCEANNVGVVYNEQTKIFAYF